MTQVNANNNEQLNTKGVRLVPNIATYHEKSTKAFDQVLSQYFDDDPGITIDGVYYEDEGGMAAMMKFNNFMEETNNISGNFTKLRDITKEVEGSVEKLVGG